MAPLRASLGVGGVDNVPPWVHGLNVRVEPPAPHAEAEAERNTQDTKTSYNVFVFIST